MRKRCLAAVLMVFCFTHFPAAERQQAAGSLKVISAKRGKSYVGTNRNIAARDAVNDVVIVLRVGGLSREEFRRLDQESIYVVAGAEKLPPNVMATGVVEGKAELLLLVVGPKATLSMSLVVANYPAVAFKAEQAVAEELR